MLVLVPLVVASRAEASLWRDAAPNEIKIPIDFLFVPDQYVGTDNLCRFQIAAA